MKIGDKVVIYRKITKQKGWFDVWVKNMDNFIGKTGTISKSSFFDNGYYIEEFGDYNFPPASLKHAK